MHLRMESLELPEQDREDAPAGTGRRADLEAPLQLAAGFLSELCQQLLLEREEPLRAAVETKARLRRLDAPAGAIEELLVEPLLERPDLQAHRGLRHAELVGGLREAAAFDDRAKRGELLGIHKDTL
jgi:hypothetical protein